MIPLGRNGSPGILQVQHRSLSLLEGGRATLLLLPRTGRRERQNHIHQLMKLLKLFFLGSCPVLMKVVLHQAQYCTAYSAVVHSTVQDRFCAVHVPFSLLLVRVVSPKSDYNGRARFAVNSGGLTSIWE